MRWTVVAGGVVLDLLGTIWLLQGLNILGGSPMTGDPFWAVAGLVVIIVGALIVALGLIRGERAAGS